MVIDNGSTDSTEKMMKTKFPHFGYLNLRENLGFSSAVNIGIQNSSTEFLALLNNDTEADARWVEAGLKALLEYPDYCFFASKIIQYFQPDRLDSAGDCYNRRGLPYKRGLGKSIDRFSSNEPTLGASAAAAFYRRALLDEIGLFDENFFMYLEDIDFSLRAQVAGRPCLYLCDAIVYHIEAASDPHREFTLPPASPIQDRPSVSGFRKNQMRESSVMKSAYLLPYPLVRESFYSPNRVYWITRNRWQLMVSYQPFRHLPFLIYGWMRSALFHLTKVGFFGSFLRGMGAGLLETPRAIKKRLAIRKGRVISTRQLCQLIRKC